MPLKASQHRPIGTPPLPLDGGPQRLRNRRFHQGHRATGAQAGKPVSVVAAGTLRFEVRLAYAHLLTDQGLLKLIPGAAAETGLEIALVRAYRLQPARLARKQQRPDAPWGRAEPDRVNDALRCAPTFEELSR